MKRTASGCIFLVALMLLFASSTTQAFVDPPTFNPVAPNSAQAISVLVRRGLCHGFIVPEPGEPITRIERSPGIVDIYSPGIIQIQPLCNIPIFTSTFQIGTLPAGSYQVRIWIIDANTDFLQSVLVGASPLTVAQGPVTQAIPTLGTGANIMLGFLICVVALIALRNRRKWYLYSMIALIASGSLSAQTNEKTLLVLLSNAPDAPTPSELVEPVNFTAGYLGTLSAGFVAQNPTRAYYLLAQRAEGDFSNWLQANPDDARAKLERYVIVTYPSGANLQSALSAMASDPNIIYASIPGEVDFATPPASSRKEPFQPNRDISKGTPVQTWINTLGLNGAWARAGGWSLVATLDNGLYTQHSDLVSFDGAGQFTGGNYLPLYARDVGRSTGNLPPALMIENNVDEREPVTTTSPVCDPDADTFMVATNAGNPCGWTDRSKS